MLHLIHESHFITWRGCTIPLFPAPDKYFCYLLCYAKTPYKHAKHYLGSTTSLDNRLYAHAHGSGARLMEVVTQAGIAWELTRLWPCETYEQMRQLERQLKGWHSGVKLCPRCQGKPLDARVLLHQGHYPFDLFVPGKRRPMH